MSDLQDRAIPSMASAKQPDNLNTASTDFIDLTVIWRRKWTILFCVALSAALGSAYLVVATPIYESIARVQIQQAQWMDPAARLRDADTLMASQAEVIRSPLVLEAVLKDVQIPEWALSGAPPMVYMLKNLMVTPIERTNVLRIDFRGPDLETSNNVVMKLIQSYEAFLKKAEFATTPQGLRLVQAREEKLQKELQALQAQHLALRQESPQIGSGRDAAMFPLNNVRDLSQQLAQTGTRKSELENRLRVAMALSGRTSVLQNVQSSQPTGPAVAEIDPLMAVATANAERVVPAANMGPSPAMADGPDVATASDPLKVQDFLWRTRAEVDRVSQIYGPRHPEIKSLNEQVSWWEKRVAASQSGQTSGLSIELEGLKAKERELTERQNKELAEARKLDSFLFREEQVVAQIHRVDELHRNAVNQLAQLETTASALNEGQAPLIVRVLEQPDLLAAQIWPKSIAFLAICAGVGLVGGCLLVVLFDRGQQPSAMTA